MQTYDILEDDRASHYLVELDIESFNRGMVMQNLPKEREDDQSSVNLSEVYSNTSNDKYISRLRDELEVVKNDHNLGRQSNKFSEIDVGSESGSLSDIDERSSCLTDRIQPKYKKLTYEEVEYSLNKYQTKEQQIIGEVELLLTFLRGQKHIYRQANAITITKYNMIMFPAMFTTGCITVVSPFIQQITWSGWAISILNALLTVMIAMNNFMKYQAVAEIFMNISNQYDSLMVGVEMSRNQFLFIDGEMPRRDFILGKMKDTENRIMDIKSNFNNVIMPHEIQLHNPIISHVNIFSFIRKIEDHKRGLILKYKDVKNEISYIMYKWENKDIYSSNTMRKETEVKRLESLLAKKDKLKLQLIHNNTTNVYTYVDNLFTREIKRSEEYYTFHSGGMYRIYPPKPFVHLKYGNPVVDNYLNFIFSINPKKTSETDISS